MVAFSAIRPYDRCLMSAYRPGVSIEDYCRACKTDRSHTIVVVDSDGKPLRVACGYCHSEHNFRGGPRIDTGAAAVSSGTSRPRSRATPGEPFAIVSDRERTAPAMTLNSPDIELLLRRIIREEGGVTPVVPAEKWRGGTLMLRPAAEGQQAKSWPIETFFHKIVMLRNRLRTLEQQVNASDLSDDVKLKLQAHVTGCYGSLTSFNVLFADDEDQFKGSGGDQDK
jgi:hypothetical protein